MKQLHIILTIGLALIAATSVQAVGPVKGAVIKGGCNAPCPKKPTQQARASSSGSSSSTSSVATEAVGPVKGAVIKGGSNEQNASATSGSINPDAATQ